MTDENFMAIVEGYRQALNVLYRGTDERPPIRVTLEFYERYKQYAEHDGMWRVTPEVLRLNGAQIIQR